MSEQSGLVILILVAACFVLICICLVLILRLLSSLKQIACKEIIKDHGKDNDSYGNGELNINFIQNQYKECYESLRQHDRTIWQMLSVAIAVDGVLLASTFRFIPEICWLRELILLIILAFTIVISISLTKLLFHCRIEKRTLTRMEQKMNQRVILRTGHRESVKHYWEYEPPNVFERISSAKLLIKGMWLIVIVIVILIILNPILLTKPLSANESTGFLAPNSLQFSMKSLSVQNNYEVV
jgi:hypothetical protein